MITTLYCHKQGPERRNGSILKNPRWQKETKSRLNIVITYYSCCGRLFWNELFMTSRRRVEFFVPQFARQRGCLAAKRQIRSARTNMVLPSSCRFCTNATLGCAFTALVIVVSAVVGCLLNEWIHGNMCYYGKQRCGFGGEWVSRESLTTDGEIYSFRPRCGKLKYVWK